MTAPFAPPGHDGPRFEIKSIGRSLCDLAPGEDAVDRRGAKVALVSTAAAVVALLALVGWLLIGGGPLS
ncbi:MAG: hypothetical protein JO127_15345 [Caulobacteraceae bacterium]|nr:hypothetical protein [Caulobacteraceae bacterium]